MNEMNSTRQITLTDLWELLLRRIVVIVLVAAIVTGGVFVLDKLTFDPEYSSTATLYIMRQTGEGNTSSGEAASELTLAQRLVYDCNYFLKSRTVLGTVIEELELDMSYAELYSRISSVNPTNTRVLEITVKGDSPEQAKAIVDLICDIGPVKVEEAMGFSHVNLYEYGTLPTTPSNSANILKYPIVAVAAAVVVYAVYLLMFILDDRIRTDEDVEKLLGLSILAEIPTRGGSGKKQYGYYSGKQGFGPGREKRS